MDSIDDKRPPIHWVYNAVHGDWSVEKRDFSVPTHLTAYGIAVYSALCAMAGNAHQCYPSIPTLAGMSGCSEKKVRESLEKLVDLGLITVTKRRISATQHDTNVYTLRAVYGGVVPIGNQVVPHAEGNESSSCNTALIYEKAFGWLPSPTLVEQMEEMVTEFGAVAFENAMKTATMAGKRDLRYVLGILRKQQTGDTRKPGEQPPAEERGVW